VFGKADAWKALWAEPEWESPTLEGSKLDSKPPPAADERATERLADYRFAQTIVTRRVVELGLAPQRAPFVSGTNG
jgi:hypothetical protein